MSFNFDYLQETYDSRNLFQPAGFLETNYAMGDYNSELSSARRIAEDIAHRIIDLNFLDEGATFADNLRTLKRSGMIDRDVIDLFYDIKDYGNKATHELSSSDQKSGLEILQKLISLLYWYTVTYCDYAGDKPGFTEPRLYSTAERHIIYSLSGDNSDGQWPAYDGLEKVGETTASGVEEDWQPNSEYLRGQARQRIGQYMGTAGAPYNVDWVELAYRSKDQSWFNDSDVHRVLLKSGYKRDEHFYSRGAVEWFHANVDQVKEAIAAVKAGQETIDGPVVDSSKIELRPEQIDAVTKTAKVFKSGYRMLWNAKMRFGKTLSALQLIKQEGYEHVLIMTHRPVVAEGWFDDFTKIGMPEAGYKYGARGANYTSLESLQKESDKYVYFASLQDLRESKIFGGKLPKNQLVKETKWDLIIIDEAHEGTQTDLAQGVLDGIKTPKYTRILELSGTPFNLMDQYQKDEVYTWDYVMEQQAKYNWSAEHPDGEPNPYLGLPAVSMYTFEMKRRFSNSNFQDLDKSFNFHEFFKVDDDGKFVFEKQIKQFLDNISSRDDSTNYPFSTPEFRNNLRHTLWLMPSVKAAGAMKDLLDHHSVFCDYNVVNIVADDSTDTVEAASDSDIARVKAAITDHPARTKSITLTVRKMTTGVTIKPWTGVIFLSNTNSAMQYLQAAFRAQTPYQDEEFGRKTNCYIFDFAPDRALKVMAASRDMSTGVGKIQTADQREKLGELLNFLPIISEDGNGMKSYKVDKLLTQLKKVFAEKAVATGFDDDSIYNDELLKISSEDLTLFNDVKAIVGQTKAEKKPYVIDVNKQGFDNEEYDKAVKAEKKPKKERTPEEEELLKRRNELKQQRKSMISVLRGISIRIPMMIYGMDIELDQDIDIQSFIDRVDPKSWEEFMPRGITKDKFREISRFYDPEIFIEAGRIIRRRVKELDQEDPLDRTMELAQIFATFRNPDKETVLTPWRVVNMQLGMTIGGLSFYDDTYQSTTKDGHPIFEWRQTNLTDKIFNNDTRILEINSKTGLYPLYIATSLYYKEFQRLNEEMAGKFSPRDQDDLWEAILDENVFAVAKTPMAKTIAQRTLAGYKGYKTNIVFVDNIVNIARESIDDGVSKIEEAFNGMKFDAVVGNPPYQQEGIGDTPRAEPIYHLFMNIAYKLAGTVSLITPARFLFNVGQTPKEWNAAMLSDPHLKVISYSAKSADLFPKTDIKGGVVITLRDTSQEFGSIGEFIPYPQLAAIVSKVRKSPDFIPLSTIVASRGQYRFSQAFFEKFPQAQKLVGAGTGNMIASNAFDKLPFAFMEDTRLKSGQVRILGRTKNKRQVSAIERSFLLPNGSLDTYNVALPKANGTGEFGERLADAILLSPGEGCTDTFISLGRFITREEAESLIKYLQTKTLRTLLSVYKVTQDNSASVWRAVPLVELKNSSTIDWGQSISQIDDQLFEKFGFDKEEIAFIEQNVPGAR